MRILRVVNNLFRRQYGFISPSVPCDSLDIGTDDGIDYVLEFERAFAEGVGSGQCVSFGAGRMAFYALLKALNIREEDEVILTGFTCSVMANAVIRVGATIKYCDIDQSSLGMSPDSLVKLITSKTKVVVAQHSFGIPCQIDKIKELCNQHHIFLIEDCALSYMSKYKGKYVGDFGDASIFSTDHTKPINTLIGGLAYTKDMDLIERLRLIQSDSESFTPVHINRIVKRYYLENRILRNNNYRKYILMLYLEVLKQRIFKNKKKVYLTGDTTPDAENNQYAYPAKYPSQLAKIGIKVLNQYRKELETRKLILKEFLGRVNIKNLPKMYFMEDVEIAPLRLVFFAESESDLKIKTQLSGIWFEDPIVNTSCRLKDFYYFGECPTSESIGKIIINIPIVFNAEKRNEMYRILGMQ